MTVEAIGFIGQLITGLGIPYEFDEWTGDFSLPFFVGEYSEIPTTTEDGMEEGTFILTGVSNNLLDLESTKDKVKEFFRYGVTEIIGSGSGIAVAYDNTLRIPTGEEGLHRIQINLNVKEWRV